MPKKKAPKGPQGESTPKESQTPQPDQQGITRITISNFKSIVGEQSIEIKPLTILAGANSSGKSSIMQPLLLLKQTVEAPYDPGALLLNGPNVQFTLADQLLSRLTANNTNNTFCVEISTRQEKVKTCFEINTNRVFDVKETIYDFSGINLPDYRLHRGMSTDDLFQEVRSMWLSDQADLFFSDPASASLLHLFQDRCFLNVTVQSFPFMYGLPETLLGAKNLVNIIHLPGLRGNPERAYPLVSTGQNFTNFSGTFENYTASVIAFWQRSNNQQKLALLNRDLTCLGLTNKIVAHQVSGVHIELLVNRLVHGLDGAEDLVNIADVGFGVSQALPVVVALHAAEPGQLVYIEQPEIHLHPRAQCAIAEVLADAALAGKRVVIETHSDLVLSSIQALVAEGKLPPELVKLHWFEQQPDGSTKITSADLDRAGAFGDWPEDFHTVILSAENRYLNAAEAQLMGE